MNEGAVVHCAKCVDAKLSSVHLYEFCFINTENGRVDSIVDSFFKRYFLLADYKLKLPDLLPNTSYIFTIRARNAVGAGNFISVPVTIPPPRKFTYVAYFSCGSCHNIFA